MDWGFWEKERKSTSFSSIWRMYPSLIHSMDTSAKQSVKPWSRITCRDLFSTAAVQCLADILIFARLFFKRIRQLTRICLFVSRSLSLSADFIAEWITIVNRLLTEFPIEFKYDIWKELSSKVFADVSYIILSERRIQIFEFNSATTSICSKQLWLFDRQRRDHKDEEREIFERNHKCEDRCVIDGSSARISKGKREMNRQAKIYVYFKECI